MRKVWLLARILLKSGGALLSQNRRYKWVMPVILAATFSGFAFSAVFITFTMYDALAPAGIADIIIPLAFGATSVVIFLFGIFYVISVMYHANDIEMLMYMPIRPLHILSAKFLTLVIYEYIFEAFILLPMLVAYAVKSGAEVPFIVYSILLFLMLPVIALVMAAVIVMVVMRFTSFGKNKQAFKFAGGILAMALAIGLNIVIQTSATHLDQTHFIAVMQNSSLASVLSNIFPGIVFASGTLINSGTIDGLLNLLLFILCSAGAFAVFLGFGQLLYLKGVAGVAETSAKRQEISDLAKKTEAASAGRSYLLKEIRLLLRSPIAFMNCVLANFIWPVILVIVLTSGGERMAAVSGIITQVDSSVIMAVIVGLSAFVSSANAITSTAISREGKSLYFMKYIPMSMKKQLMAKVRSGMVFSLISTVLLIIVTVFLGVHIGVALAGLALSLPVIAATSVGGLMIDIANPKLNWMNEQQAIKQNLNVILHILLGLLLAAVAFVPILLTAMPLWAAALYIAVVFVILLIVLIKSMNKFAVEKLNAMDA